MPQGRRAKGSRWEPLLAQLSGPFFSSSLSFFLSFCFCAVGDVLQPWLKLWKSPELDPCPRPVTVSLCRISFLMWFRISLLTNFFAWYVFTDPSPSLSHRISESLRPAIASKFRGQQAGREGNRPFQRLDEESSSGAGMSSTYRQGAAPTLSLNLYPNEKGSSFMGGRFDAATSESHTSYPSPIVSNASAFENGPHDPEEAPPAYSNRQSNVPPSASFGLGR